MRLDDEDTENGTDSSLAIENVLHPVPDSHGMNVPSTCTIVIIAGIDIKQEKDNTPTQGKYLNKVDRVMTQVDRITEDIAHMPVAAFIFRDKESDEVHYSTKIRLVFSELGTRLS